MPDNKTRLAAILTTLREAEEYLDNGTEIQPQSDIHLDIRLAVRDAKRALSELYPAHDINEVVLHV